VPTPDEPPSSPPCPGMAVELLLKNRLPAATELVTCVALPDCCTVMVWLLPADKISKVVVWRLDRLERTARDLLALLDELQALGVGFVSLREGIDLQTPAGRLMLVVLAGVSQYETEVRKERQLAGIAKAKAEGKSWGGRKVGTRVRLTVEKEKLIRQLHAEGKPVAAIARLVALTRKTVYKAIRQQEVAG
jgi:DNA invertase Pin-like site-specific DNA recombinase